MATGTLLEVVMPQMGVSVSEGTVTRWLRNVGDTVGADESLLEVSTDKVDTEVPSPGRGVLQEILVAEGETVAVGTVLARIGEAPPARPAPALPPPEPAPRAETEPPAEPAAASELRADPSSLGPPLTAPETAASRHSFISPVVARIAAEHGIDPSTIEGSGRAGRVTKRDLLARVETPPPAAAEPPAEAGRSLPASVAAAQAPAPPPVATPAAPPPPAPPPPAHAPLTPTPPPATPPAATPPVPAPPPATPPAATPPAATPPAPTPPAAIPPAAIPPAGAAAPQTPEPDEGEALGAGESLAPMSIMRRGIAEHMRRSLDTAAHVTSAIEVDMSKVAGIRERIKGEFTSAYGVNPTYLAFIARATVDTLRDWPWINAELRGESILTRSYVNLGFAVALEGGKGLIVPVLKHAEGLNLLGMARGITDLAQRARTRKLLPDDVQGGTFTITNPGSFGTLLGTPIINQPQSAILGTYAIVKRPWVISDDGGQDAIAIRSIMNLTLTYDHRLVDGAYGAQFLRDLAARLQSWGEADY